MRVAVRHQDADHPNHHWFAYQLGRIVGWSDPLSGKSYTPEEVAESLLARAQQEFPEEEGYEHRVEALHVKELDENGDEVGTWLPHGSSDLPRAGEGQSTSREVEVEQTQVAEEPSPTTEPGGTA